MIIESIVTSVDGEGQVNCAPMGVEWAFEADDLILIKPYKETTTFRNLVAKRTAVVNLTDNVLLFAQSAIASPVFPTQPAAVIPGVRLQDVCSWREVEVSKIDAREARARLTCRVVHRGFNREFLGFNRARHAVLEAAILATRTRFLPRDEILTRFTELQIIVDKTAGPREHEAMALLTQFVHQALEAL
jgi:uncharacterized protein